MILNGDNDPVHRQAGFLGGARDDPQIGLMRHHPVDLIAGDDESLLRQTRWYWGGKRPKAGLRWAVGVSFSELPKSIQDVDELNRGTAQIGGALYDALETGRADAVLAASIFHYGDYTIQQAKRYLTERGLPIRPRERPTD